MAGWFPPAFRAVHRGDEGDPAITVSAADATTAWNALAIQLAQAVATNVTVLHAGAVATSEGNGLAVVGPSGSGKSTMVAALARAGATYLSDEFAVIGEGEGEGVGGTQHQLHPWPKPLSLKRDTGDLPAGLCLPSEVGFAIGERAVPLAAIVILQHDAAAPEPVAVRRLRPAAALVELLRHSLGARTPAMLARLGAIARNVPVWTGARGEAAEVVEKLSLFTRS